MTRMEDTERLQLRGTIKTKVQQIERTRKIHQEMSQRQKHLDASLLLFNSRRQVKAVTRRTVIYYYKKNEHDNERKESKASTPTPAS